MIHASEAPVSVPQRTAYQAAITALAAEPMEFLVGGGFALHQYLGRWRSTKDLDLFLRAADVPRALGALARAGFHVELTDPAWLAKATAEGTLVDLIFSSYNRLFPVDDSWFDNAREAVVLGVPVQLVGPEEMVVSKAFVAARDRFDGSDVAWLIRTLGDALDWQRILARMDPDWEVLLWQLIHYRYVFPRQARRVPDWLLATLLERLQRSLGQSEAGQPACRGHHFDAIHYLAAGDGTDGAEDDYPAGECDGCGEGG